MAAEWILIAGLAVFLGAHAIPMLPGLRAGLGASMGEGGRKLLVTVLSIAGLAGIVWGMAYRPIVNVWFPPVWSSHLALTLMIPAMILLAMAYLPKGHVAAAVKHPMLLAVKIWALAHLLANGDLWSMALFASLLLWAGVDRMFIAKRTRAALAAGEQPPSGPVPSGPPSLRWDAAGVVVGLALYAAFVFYLHAVLFGKEVLVMGS